MSEKKRLALFGRKWAAMTREERATLLLLGALSKWISGRDNPEIALSDAKHFLDYVK